MSEVNFKIGQVVNLKSSGPDMTITGISAEYLQCTYWSPEKREFGTIKVPQDAVEIAED